MMCIYPIVSDKIIQLCHCDINALVWMFPPKLFLIHFLYQGFSIQYTVYLLIRVGLSRTEEPKRNAIFYSTMLDEWSTLVTLAEE